MTRCRHTRRQSLISGGAYSYPTVVINHRRYSAWHWCPECGAMHVWVNEYRAQWMKPRKTKGSTP